MATAAPPALMKYARRFWSLGYSRVFLVLAILFTLIALATPIWSLTRQGPPGAWDTSNYSWLGVNTDGYVGGNYDGSFYQPYSAPTFRGAVLASAVGTAFTVILVFIIFLIAVTLFYSTSFVNRLPPMGLLVVAVFITLVALAALLAPIVVIPSAAATSLNAPEYSSGLWGSSGSAIWGAGLSWWLLLVGVILGALGVFWPYLKSLRQPMVRPPPPREWQVER
jgi:hypothetical protein